MLWERIPTSDQAKNQCPLGHALPPPPQIQVRREIFLWLCYQSSWCEIETLLVNEMVSAKKRRARTRIRASAIYWIVAGTLGNPKLRICLNLKLPCLLSAKSSVFRLWDLLAPIRYYSTYRVQILASLAESQSVWFSKIEIATFKIHLTFVWTWETGNDREPVFASSGDPVPLLLLFPRHNFESPKGATEYVP